MFPWLCLAAAALLAAILARKLCGDFYGAAAAAAVYVLAPHTRALAWTDPRLGVGLALLPLLLILFYRSTRVPRDAPPHEKLIGVLGPGLCLGAFAALDPRLSTAGALLVWTILLVGYAMDRRRAGSVWGPAFSSWALACLAGILAYAPLWWMRLRHPGGLALLTRAGFDCAALWRQGSSAYIGAGACVLAAAGLLLARSYRAAARLWGIVAGIFLWMSLGADFLWDGRLLIWAPALYRGAGRLPWLRNIPPRLFAPAGQLGLGLLAAFGLVALLARLLPRRLLWTRFLVSSTVLAGLAFDYLRRR